MKLQDFLCVRVQENALVIGWQSGLIELRRAKDGKMLCKDSLLTSAIAGFVTADYRGVSKKQRTLWNSKPITKTKNWGGSHDENNEEKKNRR